MSKQVKINVILAVIISVELLLILFKFFDWERIDLVNGVTIVTSLIAIAAFYVNYQQFEINKDKRKEEAGHYRLQTYYYDKLNRIEDLEVKFTVKSQINEEKLSVIINGKNISHGHRNLQQFVNDNYREEMDSSYIHKLGKISTHPLFPALAKLLYNFYSNLDEKMLWIYSYHLEHLHLIKEVRTDIKLTEDQKKTFILKILKEKLHGYCFLHYRKHHPEFELVEDLGDEDNPSVKIIGYCQFIKKITPPSDVFKDAVGEYYDLFSKT